MAAIVDRRQRELVALLHEAGAEPLTLRDLEALGIHHPAQLIYELELAGAPIERVYRRNPSGRPGGRGLSVGAGPAPIATQPAQRRSPPGEKAQAREMAVRHD